jgi:hypothetical protein
VAFVLMILPIRSSLPTQMISIRSSLESDVK